MFTFMNNLSSTAVSIYLVIIIAVISLKKYYKYIEEFLVDWILHAHGILSYSDKWFLTGTSISSTTV